MSVAHSAEAAQQGRGRALFALVAKGALLCIASLATVVAVAIFVPDGNDYAKATVLKHARLNALTGSRIVLAGGSNLAFGIDSTVVESITGCDVVNMGMNGYLGAKFMLAEIAPALRAGDTVVIAFEYDNYYKSVDGTPADQLMIVKARPRSVAALDTAQKRAVAAAIPYVAQQKVLRIARDGLGEAWLRLFNPDGGKGTDISEIESLAGFTSHGDLVSHLGVPWEGYREDGIDVTHTPRNEQIIPLIRQFTADMNRRGITVLVSYTPVISYFYERHGKAIDDLHRELAAAPPLLVPSPPTEFVYPESLFFDTVYHLNAEGRRLRSERLAQDLLKYSSSRHVCSMKKDRA